MSCFCISVRRACRTATSFERIKSSESEKKPNTYICTDLRETFCVIVGIDTMRTRRIRLFDLWFRGCVVGLALFAYCDLWNALEGGCYLLIASAYTLTPRHHIKHTYTRCVCIVNIWYEKSKCDPQQTSDADNHSSIYIAMRL